MKLGFLLYTCDHIIDNTLLLVSDPFKKLIAINDYALTKFSHAYKHYPIRPLYIAPLYSTFPLSYTVNLVNMQPECRHISLWALFYIVITVKEMMNIDVRGVDPAIVHFKRLGRKKSRYVYLNVCSESTSLYVKQA